MLNLNTPIKYTQDERNTIKTIMNAKHEGNDRWNDYRAYNIKHRISVHCLEEQRCCCAYCESLLRKGWVQIEHISPKAITPDFVFEPENLVVSCSCCNSTSLKGHNPTIEGAVNPVYCNNIFKIVHPRLDNPDDHIKYIGKDRIVLDIPNCSDKGRYTIDFFQWNEYSANLNRATNAWMRENVPVELAKLILEISTYQA